MVKSIPTLLATGVLLVAVAVAAEQDGKNKVPAVTFEDLKFEMDEGSRFERKMLMPKIEALFGKRMQISGYMLPSSLKTGIKTFVLVRDNLQQGFGRHPKLFEQIVVQMADGKSADFSNRPFTVDGIFTFDELIDKDGKHLAIYHLEANRVALIAP